LPKVWTHPTKPKTPTSASETRGGKPPPYPTPYAAPLTADIEGVATPMSHWVKTSPSSRTVAADGALAVAAARHIPGRIATLILPADTAWGPAADIAEAAPPLPAPQVSDAAVKAAAAPLPSAARWPPIVGG